ncbi:hypothetical protein IDH44_00260 [Paenibacillus sp. IB182496]|uniref:Lipoprotein n=1 Tax=Paenibacillus sabuli TaxID=2772509 RepID=A0A927BP02_9BACL|nr:hypothetical protein [Paenibacillus sabuli]MBD2843607.1 hypothetical protein [Paenibacillus sabuli]
MKTLNMWLGAALLSLLAACGNAGDAGVTNAPNEANAANAAPTDNERASAGAGAAATGNATGQHQDEAEGAGADQASAAKAPQQSDDEIAALLPDGWERLHNFEASRVQAEGDLNRDGRSDVVIVIERKGGEGVPLRALLIALRHEDGSLERSIVAEQVMLKEDEGGVWGDPFESVAIDRGSVVVSHYGGSNWRWYSAYRFRYQQADWYLIGATTGSYFTATTTREQADEADYNLLTGDYSIRTTNADGEVEIQKGKQATRPLIELRAFRHDLNLQDQD